MLIAFLLPAILVYTFSVFIPVLVSLFYSLNEWDGITGMKFVGLKNYTYMLFNDKRFYKPFLLRKFWNYQFNYKRIDKTLRKEFLDTIKNEFILNNNSDLSLFSELEKKILNIILVCDSYLIAKFLEEITWKEINRYQHYDSLKIIKYRILKLFIKKYRQKLKLIDEINSILHEA